MTCKCLSEDKKHAFRKSMTGHYDVKVRVNAVRQLINIDTERERKTMINQINNGEDMLGKRIKITNDNKCWRDGEIVTYDGASKKASIELEGGDLTCVTLSEAVASTKCWIYNTSKHVHPLHQITVPTGHITVRRADGQILADST